MESGEDAGKALMICPQLRLTLFKACNAISLEDTVFFLLAFSNTPFFWCEDVVHVTIKGCGLRARDYLGEGLVSSAYARGR